MTKFPPTPGPSAFPLKMPALNSQTLETFYAEELVSTPPHSPNTLGLPQKLIRGSAQPRAFQPGACPSATHHTHPSLSKPKGRVVPEPIAASTGILLTPRVEFS